MPALTVLDGASPGMRLSLDSIEVGQTKKVRTQERRAGAGELRVQRTEQGYCVLQGERHEVRVNGRPVSEERLQHGDLVKAGPLVLIFSEDDDVVPRERQSPDPFETDIDLRIEQAGDVSDVLKAAAAASEERAGELLAFSAGLAVAQSVTEVLELAAAKALDMLDGDRALAVLLRADRRGPRATGHCLRDGAPHEPPLKISRAVGQDVVGLAMTVGSVDRMPAKPDKVRSALCAPIIAAGEVIGMLHVDKVGTVEAFGETPAQRLTALGHLAGGSLETARGGEERDRHGRRLRALAAATRRLSSVLRRDAVISQAAAMASAILGCKRASVLLRDDAGTLRVAGGVGIPQELTGDEVGMESGVARSVVEGRRPINVTDDQAPGPHTAGRGRYRSRSYLAVPILARGVDSAETGAIVGVFCATERLGDRPFTSGDGDLLAVIASATGAALVAADLREALALDALTGIASRPYCEARLQQEIKIARDGAAPLTVLMVDLDHFKLVNDRLGHAAGDRVLACVGQVLAGELRGDDVAARWGGEEFVVLLPGAAAEEAEAVAERLRTQVRIATAQLEGGAPVTASIGLAQWREGEGGSELVGRADAALYASKRSGRDRVTTSHPKPESAS